MTTELMMIQPNATSAYREAAIRGASRIELVILMYDMLVEDLTRAIDAIRTNDIEKRATQTKHAISVLEQLQLCLNMKEGGEAAECMDRLYSIARAKVLEAHIKSSPAIYGEQIRIFTDLREAWRQAESNQSPQRPATESSDTNVPAGEIPIPFAGSTFSVNEPAVYDWSA
jgi:flagellar secretion chaperone FliS